MNGLYSGGFAPTAGTATAPARFAAFILLAGERLWHDGLLRHLGQLEVGLLLFLERFGEEISHLLLAGGFGQRHIDAVGGDFIVLDTLHARDDDEIEDRAFLVMLLDFVLGLFDQPAHRLADLAAWTNIHFFHRLLDALDLHLRLLDVHLDALAQRFGAGLAHGPLHAAERLLLGAVSVLQLLSEQFANFRFHGESPSSQCFRRHRLDPQLRDVTLSEFRPRHRIAGRV